jgi:hypothetical protein
MEKFHETVELTHYGSGVYSETQTDYFGLSWQRFDEKVLELASKQAGHEVVATCSFCGKTLKRGWMCENLSACCEDYVREGRK